jgi:hypothetical protein
MAEILRVLMVEEQPDQARQMKKLLNEAEHSGRLPSLQVQFEQAVRLEDERERLAAGAYDA